MQHVTITAVSLFVFFLGGVVGGGFFCATQVSVPAKTLLTVRGLSPWMEPFPPSILKPTPPGFFSNSIAITSPVSSTSGQRRERERESIRSFPHKRGLYCSNRA